MILVDVYKTQMMTICDISGLEDGIADLNLTDKEKQYSEELRPIIAEWQKYVNSQFSCESRNHNLLHWPNIVDNSTGFVILFSCYFIWQVVCLLCFKLRELFFC